MTIPSLNWSFYEHGGTLLMRFGRAQLPIVLKYLLKYPQVGLVLIEDQTRKSFSLHVTKPPEEVLSAIQTMLSEMLVDFLGDI